MEFKALHDSLYLHHQASCNSTEVEMLIFIIAITNFKGSSVIYRCLPVVFITIKLI